MLEIPVKLIVKAPNQQVEDQTIHCNLSWTIKKLKGYLSEVYPSKPNTEDQRLIYYGQLLNDNVTLKDVFTRYEAGEETHTVHLVCMPSKETLKMQARKVAEENSKKLKERNMNNAPSSLRLNLNENGNVTNDNRNSSQPMQRSFFPYGYQNWMNEANSQSSPNNNYFQQWAWMQQVYANYYMSQYMNMIARQNGVGVREGYGAQQNEPPHNPELQVQRDFREAVSRLIRDCLDFFYALSRLLVLLGFVYFYSSPARFFIVSSLGVAFYLYQLGFFRINQLQAAENNEAVNNNIPPENNNVIPQGEVGARRGENVPAQQNPEQIVEAPEHRSFIALTWTFVSSFFSSIIPETHNAV